MKADQKSRGRYLGGKVPYGYQLATEGAESVLVPVPEQQAVIARVSALRAEGKPLRAIQAVIGSEGTALSLDAISRISRPGQEGAP